MTSPLWQYVSGSALPLCTDSTVSLVLMGGKLVLRPSTPCERVCVQVHVVMCYTEKATPARHRPERQVHAVMCAMRQFPLHVYVAVECECHTPKLLLQSMHTLTCGPALRIYEQPLLHTQGTMDVVREL